MDLEGSVATKNFIRIYDTEEAKQDKQIEKLQDEVKHLETMKLRIERLEEYHKEKANP